MSILQGWQRVWTATSPPSQPRLQGPFAQPTISDSLGVDTCSLFPKGPAAHRYAPAHSSASRQGFINYLQKVTECGTHHRVSVLL